MPWNREEDTGRKRQIMQKLEYTPVTVEEIWNRMGNTVSVGELQIALMELLLEGKVVQPATGYFCKNR